MGILIKWKKDDMKDDMIEYLDCIDPDNPEGLRNMITTREWRRQQERWVKYNAKCCIKRNGQGTSGGHIVVLTYNKENNLHLEEGEMICGTNKIFIEPGKNHGKCRWAADGKKEVYTLDWERNILKLYEERNHRRSTQQIRDKKFRCRIIPLDEKCVISGETTEAALDAAHIIPAAQEGNEIPENGITLRADIHRLYDRGIFQIHPERGQAMIDPARLPELSEDYINLSEDYINLSEDYINLSEDYINLLKNGKLPDATLQRVQKALQKVWGGE